MKFIKATVLFSFILAVIISACGQERSQSESNQSAGDQRPLRLFLVRHAEAFKNLDPLPSLPLNQLDSLTTAGKNQAAALGHYLKSKRIRAIYASPTGRTRQTAEIISQTIEFNNPVIVDNDLISLRKGQMSSLQALSSDADVSQGKTNMTTWGNDGESLAEGQQRVIALLNRLTKQYSGQAIVFVTHGDICTALLAYATGISPDPAQTLPGVRTGSVSEIQIGDDRWVLKEKGVMPIQP